MPAPAILVTGANGQLGTAIRALSVHFPEFHFLFPGREALPVDDAALVQQYFENNVPAFCINCAAYTAVDKAETDREMAMKVNGAGAGLLAAVCKSFKTKLIHISTDYVFNGAGSVPYKEEDATEPVNYYGATKLEGEKRCFENNSGSIVIRTSWVYSEFGNNFVKTMMRLMSEKSSINVVNDQLGSPTCAVDLAEFILTLISGCVSGSIKWEPGIYHYSNAGVISWYDFAAAIKNISKSSCLVNPVPGAMFPTVAKRPAYSVMSKEKIQQVYDAVIADWQDSLAACIARLQKRSVAG
jgi:dTDP-4-dehydrorhamnose reductase